MFLLHRHRCMKVNVCLEQKIRDAKYFDSNINFCLVSEEKGTNRSFCFVNRNIKGKERNRIFFLKDSHSLIIYTVAGCTVKTRCSHPSIHKKKR